MDSDKTFELVQMLHRAGVIDDEARQKVSEGQRFAKTSLHVGQILILQNVITASELKFDLETLEAVRAGRLTEEQAIISVRELLPREKPRITGIVCPVPDAEDAG